MSDKQDEEYKLPHRFSPVKSNFPRRLIIPFTLNGSDLNHFSERDVLDAIDKEWCVPEANHNAVPHNKINFMWHVNYLLQNCIRSPQCYPIPFSFRLCYERFTYTIKALYLLLKMTKEEKGLYINGYQWSPARFFGMKQFAEELENQGMINCRDNQREVNDTISVNFTRTALNELSWILSNYTLLAKPDIYEESIVIATNINNLINKALEDDKK